jgi:N-formylglutamate deformylase
MRFTTTDLPGVYSRRDPATALPIVFDIPRSGREYPSDFNASASFADLHHSVSKHVEALYDGVTAHGATWLYARFPNAYIDANRAETDIDPETLDGPWLGAPLAPSDKSRAGIGLIPQVLRGKRPVYATPRLASADVLRRIDQYYRPYHDTLAQLLAEGAAQHGAAYHLSCHSMGSTAPAGTANAGQPRSAFDLGDRRGETADPAFVDFLQTTLQGFGYEVTRNAHFIGAECVRRHGQPARGIHSVQIEMRRNLFMDEATGERHAGFAQVQAHMTALAEAVARYAQAHANR